MSARVLRFALSYTDTHIQTHPSTFTTKLTNTKNAVSLFAASPMAQAYLGSEIALIAFYSRKFSLWLSLTANSESKVITFWLVTSRWIEYLWATAADIADEKRQSFHLIKWIFSVTVLSVFLTFSRCLKSERHGAVFFFLALHLVRPHFLAMVKFGNRQNHCDVRSIRAQTNVKWKIDRSLNRYCITDDFVPISSACEQRCSRWQCLQFVIHAFRCHSHSEQSEQIEGNMSVSGSSRPGVCVCVVVFVVDANCLTFVQL